MHGLHAFKKPCTSAPPRGCFHFAHLPCARLQLSCCHSRTKREDTSVALNEVKLMFGMLRWEATLVCPRTEQYIKETKSTGRKRMSIDECEI